MKIIILAAGEGTRLRPLTENIPKCMVKLFGKSILETQIETYRGCGISDISVVTGYLGNSINIDNIKYYRNPNFKNTNMVETLFCAKENLNDSVIVAYGDIVFERKILEKLIKSKDDISITIDTNWEKYWKTRFQEPLDDAESLRLDSNGYILDIGQKINEIEEIQGQFIGLMKFEQDGINNLKKFYEKVKKESTLGENPLNPNLPFEKSFMTDLLRGMIKSGYKLKSVPIENGWLEIDSYSDYQLYNNLQQKNLLKNFIDLGQDNE